MDTKTQLVEAKLEMLTEAYGHYMKLNCAIEDAMEVGMLDINGPLCEALFEQQEYLMGKAGLDWLEWYVFETDCGREPMDAHVGDWSGPVTCLRDLASVMVEDELLTASN